MPQEIKQKRKWCSQCKTKTLHQATVNRADLGCGVMMGHLFLSVITLGIWVPFWVLFTGIGMLGNAVAPMGAKYRCQNCGK